MASKELVMESVEIRKFLHDLSNYLNAAKINTYLLRRMHSDNIDRETLDGLDSALLDAEKLTGDFQHRIYAESNVTNALPNPRPEKEQNQGDMASRC